MKLTASIRKPRRKIERLAALRLAKALHALAVSTPRSVGNPISAFGEITIVFAGDGVMAQVHFDAMGIEGSADVVTIPYAATPMASASAEIYVNVDLACERGVDRSELELISSETSGDWSPEHELALYVAHGLDHLAGGDDSTPEGFKEMREREISWVRKAERAGLLNSIFKPEVRKNG